MSSEETVETLIIAHSIYRMNWMHRDGKHHYFWHEIFSLTNIGHADVEPPGLNPNWLEHNIKQWIRRLIIIIIIIAELFNEF
jgi:hypothetical protein